MSARRDVPCGTCRLCCQGGEAILLFPHLGDDPGQYQTVETPVGLMIAQRENGDCVYLDERGCSIHDRAPVICREFDCIESARRIGYGSRARRLIHQQVISVDVLRRGRELLRSKT
jgi:Fe-S-cluster containining protein